MFAQRKVRVHSDVMPLVECANSVELRDPQKSP